MRRVAAELTRSMTVRMAERERIARTLHDTILQGVQSIILRLHAMSRGLPSGSAFRTSLEALLAQADKTVSEGRDQIQDLRRALNADLPGLVTNSGRDLAGLYPDMAFELRVTGIPATVQPELCEEIGEIVREAMRNACRHSGGDTVTVDIAYRFGTLALRIADNGKGIGAHVSDSGEPRRHWGLTGMRERAGKIGAALEITSVPSTGTVVELSVPVRRA
jgi:signal transduction histidine kinase